MWQPKGQLSQPGGEERIWPGEDTLTEQKGTVRHKTWQSILAKGTEMRGGVWGSASISLYERSGMPASREKDGRGETRQARAGASSAAEEAIWIFILWALQGSRRLHAERW